jgi:glucose-6-phosphate 1-dehydrogenase
MNSTYAPRDTKFVVFGADGDLARRKGLPTFYKLSRQGRLPENFKILGAGLSEMTDADFRNMAKTSTRTLAADLPFDEASWERFAQRLHYRRVDVTNSESVSQIKEGLKKLYGGQAIGDHTVFYLSTPPSIYGQAVESLVANGLVERKAGDDQWPKLVLEKPFGNGLAAAERLDDLLHGSFSERQIYRVDHYLGKHSVENILALRFLDGRYEHLWNRRFIQSIRIVVAETDGVGQRAIFYDHDGGALRDMVQSHLLQLLSSLLMEKPQSLVDPEAINAEKTSILQALRPIDPRHVDESVVAGQYGPGTVGEKTLLGYRQESNVAALSMVETFAAMKVFVDTETWNGVPIFMSTGKRLGGRLGYIVVKFFKSAQEDGQISSNTPEAIVFHIQPETHISVRMQEKAGSPNELRLNASDCNSPATVDAGPETGYENIMLDVASGNRSRFSSSAFNRASWRFLGPILAGIRQQQQAFPNYRAGSWGPLEARRLVANAGNR